MVIDGDMSPPPRTGGNGYVVSQAHWMGKAGTNRPLPPRWRPLNEYLYGQALPDDAETPVAHAPLDKGTAGRGSIYDALGSSYTGSLIGQGQMYSGSTGGRGTIWGLRSNTNFGTSPDGFTQQYCINIDAVPNASEFVALGEAGVFYHGWSWENPAPAPDAQLWSFGIDDPRFNCGFLDGHGAMINVKPGDTWGDGFRFSWKDKPTTNGPGPR